MLTTVDVYNGRLARDQARIVVLAGLQSEAEREELRHRVFYKNSYHRLSLVLASQFPAYKRNIVRARRFRVPVID